MHEILVGEDLRGKNREIAAGSPECSRNRYLEPDERAGSGKDLAARENDTAAQEKVPDMRNRRRSSDEQGR